MSIHRIFYVIQIANLVSDAIRDKEFRDLLRKKGYSEEYIRRARSAIEYWTYNQRDKDKLCGKVVKKLRKENTNFVFSRVAFEENISTILIEIFQHEDILQLLIKDMSKAKEIHKEAVALRDRINSSPQTPLDKIEELDNPEE